MPLVEAQLLLGFPVEEEWWGDSLALVLDVKAVDRRPAVDREGQERTDTIHRHRIRAAGWVGSLTGERSSNGTSAQRS
jgi:hypothetical protein